MVYIDCPGCHRFPIPTRVVRIATAAAPRKVSAGKPQTLYFDSYAYVPSFCSDETLAGCDAPAEFYGAILDNHFAWEDTWRSEGRMAVQLPTRPQDTDGALLATQATHAIVLDMITRTGEGTSSFGFPPLYFGCFEPDVRGHT